MDALSSIRSNLHYVTVAFILILTTLIMVKKYFFSKRLRLPPGPPGWPIIGNMSVMFQDKRCRSEDFALSKYCREYGDIYMLKFGSDLMYVLGNVDKVRKAFAHSKIQDRVTSHAYKIAMGQRASGLLFGTGSNWKVIHRFTRDLFRDIGVGREMFSKNIKIEIDRFVARIDTLVGKPCYDLTGRLQIALGNVICGILFGQKHDFDDTEFQTVIQIIRSVTKQAGPGFIVLTSKWLCTLPFGPGKNLVRVLRKFQDIMVSHINEPQPGSEDSLPYYVKLFLEEMKSGDAAFNEDNLTTCCIDLLGAGTESSTNTIQWGILCLTNHPSIQEKCRNELDVFVEDHGRMPVYADRCKLTYIQATILEIERIASVSILGVPHKTEEDLQLFGYDFPKGTAVTCNFVFINNDPERFPEPDKFKPERFIEGGVFRADPDIIPFSVGRRACPGEQLARMEIFLFLATILHRYTLTPPDNVKMPGITEAIHGISRMPCPYGVIFSRREK